MNLSYSIFLFGIIYAELILIQETFRHGARYPIRSQFNNYPTYLLGELTQVGKRMHYLLGKKLYDQYWEKLNLPDYYDSKYFYVKSTDFNRTIQSAESHIIGILDKVKPQTIGSSQYALPDWKLSDTYDKFRLWNSQSINFSSMPIHVAKRTIHTQNFSDFLLNYEYYNCLEQQKWGRQNLQSKYYKRMEPLVIKYCEILQQEFNLTFCNITDISNFVDNYYTNMYLGNPVHNLFNDEKIKKDLIFLYTQGVIVRYFLQQIQINATVTPFLIATRQNLYKARFQPRQKWIIYSAHDLTLLNILSSLNSTTAQCVQEHYYDEKGTKCNWQYPPYASNLIIQLEKQLDQYFVRVRYNGIYINLSFCINPQNCTFVEFETFLNQTILLGYEKICKFNNEVSQQNNKNNSEILIKVLSLFLFLDLIYLIYRLIDFCLKRRQQQKDQNSINNEQKEGLNQENQLQEL